MSTCRKQDTDWSSDHDVAFVFGFVDFLPARGPACDPPLITAPEPGGLGGLGGGRGGGRGEGLAPSRPIGCQPQDLDPEAFDTALRGVLAASAFQDLVAHPLEDAAWSHDAALGPAWGGL